MTLGDLGNGAQDFLEDAPAADRIDEALVFHRAPLVERVRGGFGPAQPFLGQQAAGQRAIGEQLDALSRAERRHLFAGAAVEQRVADLVGGDARAVVREHVEMVGVEICGAEVTDKSLVPESGQLVHGVEPAGMLERPPVELKKVDALGLHPAARPIDGRAHHLRRHRPGSGAPLGEGRGPVAEARPDAAGGEHAVEMPGDDLGAAVVVGHVEGVEAGRGIGRQLRRGALRVERLAVAFHVCDLPQAGDHAADGEPRRELDALWCGNVRHVCSERGEGAAEMRRLPVG